MENKFKEFWIELEEKGARAFVYTEPVDGLNDDAIHAVEYAALESANDKIAELKEDIREDRVKPDDYLYLATVNKRLESENKKLSEHLESANAEIERYKLFAEHEFKIKDKLYAENTRLQAALESINVGVMSMYLDRDHMISDFKKTAREALKTGGADE